MDATKTLSSGVFGLTEETALEHSPRPPGLTPSGVNKGGRLLMQAVVPGSSLRAFVSTVPLKPQTEVKDLSVLMVYFHRMSSQSTDLECET